MWIWLTIVLLLVVALIGFIVYHFLKIKRVRKECPKQVQQECPVKQCPECPKQVQQECPVKQCPELIGLMISSPNEETKQLWNVLQRRMMSMQEMGCKQIKEVLKAYEGFLITEMRSFKSKFGNNVLKCDDVKDMIHGYMDAVTKEVPPQSTFYVNEVSNILVEVIALVCKDGYIDADKVLYLINGVFDSVCPGTSAILTG